MNDIPKVESSEAGLRIESHKAKSDDDTKRPNSRDQETHTCATHIETGIVSIGDELSLEESNDQQSVPTTDGRICDGLAFGYDILISQVDADDYTATGGDIVSGFDGAKKCPVLLLTYDLSTQMQAMLRFRRVVLKEEREANARLTALANFEAALAREISNHQRLVAQAAESEQVSTIDAGDEPDRIENMKDELENLERLDQGAQNNKLTVESNLTMRRTLLQEYQEDINRHLEAVFVFAQAMEEASDEEEIEVPEISVQEEYRKLMFQIQGLHGTTAVEKSLKVTAELVPASTPAVSPERQSRIAASKALWAAGEDLQYARVQFEERNASRQRELQQIIAAELHGEPVVFSSVEEFDLSWVVRFRELTRELLDAEEGLSRARAAAKDAGLALEHDTQSSCFPDDAADGQLELMSSEIDSPETFAGDPRMIAWMDSLVDSADPEFSDPAEVDDWGSGEEVLDSDSASVVAHGSERRRIDAWRRAGMQ